MDIDTLITIIGLIAGFIAIYEFMIKHLWRKTVSNCGPILEDYLFVTKASAGQESDKSPTYVSHSGGYVLDKKLSNCTADIVNIEFLGAHYAQDYGLGKLTVEIYDEKSRKFESTSFSIGEQINDWRDVNNKNKMKPFHEIVEIDKSKKISNIKVYIVPGNWATVIHDLKIKLS